MEKFEKIGFVLTSLAAIGVIVFWVAGFSDVFSVAKYSLFGAGIFAWGALAAFGIHKLRRRNLGY